MADLIRQYYAETSEARAKEFPRGQLCRAPGYYLPEYLNVLALEYYDPRNERNNRYSLRREPPNIFDHTPVHELNLRSDEEFVVVKCKHRPFVIASRKLEEWVYPSGQVREECYVGVPLYSFHERDSIDFKNRIRCLEYPYLIHLPSDDQLMMKEGFARLDRIQIIAKRLLIPSRIALTSDALFFLSEWLRFYLTGEIDKLFLEYREEILKELHKS